MLINIERSTVEWQIYPEANESLSARKSKNPYFNLIDFPFGLILLLRADQTKYKGVKDGNYNYDGFSTDTYNLDKFHGPILGSKALDFELSTADEKQVNLLDFEGDFLVLELGSNIQAHKTDADKTACAVKLKNNDQESRQIFIDDIDGTAHSAYGSYHNAIFIINKNGCVVYRSDWNTVPSTKTALNKLASGQPAHNKSYFLPVKPTTALKVLRKNGKGRPMISSATCQH